MKKSLWILGITRGHNSGVCLLKDGKIIFSLEEERLSRSKYDGSPFATMHKVLEYTNKLDYIAVAHTQPLQGGPITDFSHDSVYVALARKLKLIDNKIYNYGEEGQISHPQVIDYSHMHHKLHAITAFYRSGFDEAAAVIIDGAGTFIPLQFGDTQLTGWEVESIFDCTYPSNFKTLYKHVGIRGNSVSGIANQPITTPDNKDDSGLVEYMLTERCGIVKAYEAVTEYCGFSAIEAGKTMGLSPYGTVNDKIPEIFDKTSIYPLANRNLLTPMYPRGAIVNDGLYEYLRYYDNSDPSLLQNRRDLAFAVQIETQKEAYRLIKKAVELSNQKNVVISGGYGLNCVSNYYYLDEAKKDGINLYIEPISNDAGTAIGAALYHHAIITETSNNIDNSGIYFGPEYDYTNSISAICKDNAVDFKDITYKEIVKLLRGKNIVAMFQGRSENGPRALGNRSILFDPTFKDGKDLVNSVKRREYFRPFAGTVLKEYADKWFDLRGLEESPYMMYAVNCKDEYSKKIPSVIHVDGTCRIQTVTPEQNKHFYELIEEFYKETSIPLLFNTSFNLAGEPLVETLEDAIHTLKNSEIEYLFLPQYNKLITVFNND